ncbi:hypothetical protein BDV26DRAFT_278068 [Aspergillus bertholletiae]|uniref:Uncharacterized protein n=1 Tax=Aspergillus bertholletiae TaxID=1226010 RepID=A0A5N7BL80_9EURO|nr:hypothetical protein BDV26DRAFT_278068 [Aspergillus bertholletiae]
MIDYLYRKDYDDTSELTIEEQTRSSPEQVALNKPSHISIYIVANKYAINGLMDLAKKRIRYVYGPHAPANSNLQDTVATFTTRHISTLKELQSFHEICKNSPHFVYKFSTLLMERVVQLETELW